LIIEAEFLVAHKNDAMFQERFFDLVKNVITDAPGDIDAFDLRTNVGGKFTDVDVSVFHFHLAPMLRTV